MSHLRFHASYIVYRTRQMPFWFVRDFIRPVEASLLTAEYSYVSKSRHCPHLYWLRRERRPHMRNNFLCMSSFPANIPAKPAPFSFGLGNKDNWSFQPNLDLTLPKWLILKLATNYLPLYLFHPFSVSLNFSPPPHKNTTNIFSNFPLWLQN